MVRVALTATILSIALASASSAAVIAGWTEGSRDLVNGTSPLSDAPPSGGGVPNLGELQNVGDTIELYGRVVQASDAFAFSFSTDRSFRIEFNFDGYTAGGSVVADSGLVNESGSGSKQVDFSLSEDGSTVRGPASFFTNTTVGSPLIFSGVASGSPAEYTLLIDGGAGGSASDNIAALYDIRISAVPVPAALPLLALGLSGLGYAAYRRRRTG